MLYLRAVHHPPDPGDTQGSFMFFHEQKKQGNLQDTQLQDLNLFDDHIGRQLLQDTKQTEHTLWEVYLQPTD
jgi:hypothetical protein